MAEGIGEVQGLVGDVVAVVNAQQKLFKRDYKLVIKQILDLDEDEAVQLAKDFEILDLNDDALEAKLEAYAHLGGKPLSYALRILRLFIKFPVVAK